MLFGLLAAFAVLALFSIGALVFPMVALLGCAALLSRRPREA